MTASDNTEQPIKPARDENGRLLPGHTANPHGSGKRAYQPYGVRADYLIEKLGPEGLERIIANPKEELKKYGWYDRTILQRLIKGAKDEGNSLETESILTRIEGAPKQVVDINHSGAIGTFPLTDAERARQVQALIDAARARAAGGDSVGAGGVESAAGSADGSTQQSG